MSPKNTQFFPLCDFATSSCDGAAALKPPPSSPREPPTECKYEPPAPLDPAPALQRRGPRALGYPGPPWDPPDPPDPHPPKATATGPRTVGDTAPQVKCPDVRTTMAKDFSEGAGPEPLKATVFSTHRLVSSPGDCEPGATSHKENCFWGADAVVGQLGLLEAPTASAATRGRAARRTALRQAPVPASNLDARAPLVRSDSALAPAAGPPKSLADAGEFGEEAPLPAAFRTPNSVAGSQEARPSE